MDRKSQDEILKRLPKTFAAALREQLQQWDLLFPAEQRTIQSQVDWLARLPQSEFERLFGPIRSLESRMDLSGWDSGSVTIDNTGLLVRSPLYPQWRAEVESVFARVDDALAAPSAARQPRRLVICVLPAGVSLPPARIWPNLEEQGQWIPLAAPFDAMLDPLVRAIATRPARAGVDPVERTWALEYGSRLSGLGAASLLALSFDGLGPLRRQFLSRLNQIPKDIRAADRAYEDLRKADIRHHLDAALRSDQRVSELVRGLFLSGNGALLFGNSFVQWGASETLRRVRCQALFCCFGVRPKLKPFSSLVLFEDQNRANPVRDEPDGDGSLIDTRMLSEYVYLSARRVQSYRGQCLSIFAAPALPRVLVLGQAPPADLLDTAGLLRLALEWLA